MPNSCAFFNLLPASSPATKKLVFLDTDDENFPEFFSIKAVSDFANSRKNDGYQEYCAYVSANLLFELIPELIDRRCEN